MLVETRDGTPLELKHIFAEGGEAAIWTIHREPERVAKIYHEPMSVHEEKLAAMVANPPLYRHHPAVAWPQNLLYRQGQCVGYLMPNVPDSIPIFQYYNPARRRLFAPDQRPLYPWPYVLHHVAKNLAAAVAGVHDRGHVIGDLNESNVLVNPQGLVTLVDTDSFQIRRPDPETRPLWGLFSGAGSRVSVTPWARPNLRHQSFKV